MHDENNLYYTGSKWTIGNPDYYMYMCEGARSRGKTTCWLHKCTSRSLNALLEGDENKKFIFLRRSSVQMQLVIEKGLYNSVRSHDTPYGEFYDEFPTDTQRKSKIYLNHKSGKSFHVGYYVDLNNIKGISIEDADVLIFDEYVELKRNDYKGGDGGLHEPELFARLLETLFRGRKFWVVMLANSDTYSNPYNEYFNIPYATEKYRDKNRGIWYEKDIAPPVLRDKRAGSVLGRLFAGTRYNSYALGDTTAVGINDEFISDKTNHSKMLCNIRILGKNLTLWYDENTGVEYVSDKYKFDYNYPVLSVTRDDMSVNTEFVAYNAMFLLQQKTQFGQGRVRFSSGKVGELFYIMIGLLS